MSGALLMPVVLAGEEDVGKAGPVGLFIILSLLIAVFLLGRSMRTHLRRVPQEFSDIKPKPAGQPRSTGTDGAGLEGGIEGEILDPPDRRRRPGSGRPNEPGSSPPDSA